MLVDIMLIKNNVVAFESLLVQQLNKHCISAHELSFLAYFC